MQNLPDMSEIMRLAQTREGRSLIAMLQSADPAALHMAAENAKKGNMDAAKEVLSGLLDTPEGKALLKQLGR